MPNPRSKFPDKTGNIREIPGDAAEKTKGNSRIAITASVPQIRDPPPP
jgi:hypothetical protein